LKGDPSSPDDRVVTESGDAITAGPFKIGVTNVPIGQLIQLTVDIPVPETVPVTAIELLDAENIRIFIPDKSEYLCPGGWILPPMTGIE
jgi:hypothetical protein